MGKMVQIKRLLAGGLIVGMAALSHAASDPALTCGVAHTRLQAGFAKGALALGTLLCKDPTRFTERATALVAKTNKKIASFNQKFANYGCDADVPLPVAAKNTAQVMLVLQNDVGAAPLDRFCNGLDDSELCGNAQEDPGESCDGSDLGGQSCASLGNGTGTLTCSADCQSFDLAGCSGPPYCGNDDVDAGEACDAGGQSATCDFDCTLSGCGDGLVNAAAGEQCDDGNSSNTDACPNCQIPLCGDGFVRVGIEQCDDGNLTQTDACANCNFAVCGDGFTRTGVEECDDGGTTAGDGCDATCQSE